MPFLEGPFAFTGKLDMLSAYRMRGVDGIVIRRKGGPSREKIKTSPRFENTRHTMSEFGGCSRLGSYVRLAMHSIRQLSDYNFGSDINSVMRQVQLRDDTGAWGRRKIILSEHARILEGFQTTKKAPSFDSIVRTPVYYTMDRANRSARVEIPELLRDINYFPQNNHAMFRLTITLGIVPDLRYDIAEKEYLAAKWYDQACYAKSVSTDWNPSLEGMGSTALEVAMNVLPPEDGWTLMLAIGIQYGVFRENGKIEEAKRFGAAKILALRGKDGASGRGVGDDGAHTGEVEFVDEVVTEDVATEGNDVKQDAYREPEVRYVYTMKEVAAEKRKAVVYSYAISPADVHVVTTTDGIVEERSPTENQALQPGPVPGAGVSAQQSAGAPPVPRMVAVSDRVPAAYVHTPIFQMERLVVRSNWADRAFGAKAVRDRNHTGHRSRPEGKDRRQQSLLIAKTEISMSDRFSGLHVYRPRERQFRAPAEWQRGAIHVDASGSLANCATTYPCGPGGLYVQILVHISSHSSNGISVQKVPL